MVSGGNFESGHPGELATDGDEDTYLSAIPAAGDSVTLTCRFKRIYGVKHIRTLLPSSAIFGVGMELYSGNTQVMTFLSLDRHSIQTQSPHTTAYGDQILFTLKFNKIKLADIEIYVENQSSYSGKKILLT